MGGLNQKTYTNGCGTCGGFWKWFKPPHYNFFREECNTHDKLYSKGGIWTDRLKADITLLKDMYNKISSHFYKRKIISRYWYYILTLCYYVGVRIFGKPNFKYEKKRYKFRF